MYATGALHVLKWFRLRNRGVVVTYHRVLSEEDGARTWSHPAIVVNRSIFDRQMALLRREFQPLSLDRFVAAVQGRAPFPRYACLVTFDDGWWDTCTEAWPVMRRHGVPGVFFITVGLVGTADILWQERLRAWLDIALEAARADDSVRVAVEDVLKRHGYGDLIGLRPAETRRAIIDAVLRHKYDDEASALAPLTELESLLAGRADPSAGPDIFMTWPMVREMAEQGAVFGGHGASHRLLPRLTGAELEAEIALSVARIHAELGRRPGAFAYPDGKWTPAVVERLQEYGYELAFGTDGGFVGSGDSLWNVRRVNMNDAAGDTPAMLLARILGVV